MGMVAGTPAQGHMQGGAAGAAQAHSRPTGMVHTAHQAAAARAGTAARPTCVWQKLRRALRQSTAQQATWVARWGASGIRCATPTYTSSQVRVACAAEEGLELSSTRVAPPASGCARGGTPPAARSPRSTRLTRDSMRAVRKPPRSGTLVTTGARMVASNASRDDTTGMKKPFRRARACSRVRCRR